MLVLLVLLMLVMVLMLDRARRDLLVGRAVHTLDGWRRHAATRVMGLQRRR